MLGVEDVIDAMDEVTAAAELLATEEGTEVPADTGLLVEAEGAGLMDDWVVCPGAGVEDEPRGTGVGREVVDGLTGGGVFEGVVPLLISCRLLRSITSDF